MALETNGSNVVWLSSSAPDQIQQHLIKKDPLLVESAEEQRHLHQQEHRYQRSLIKIPNHQTQQIGQPVKCSMFTQTEQTNSFTQTEQSGSSYNDQRQQATMFDPQQIQQQQAPQGQQSQQQQQSQQMYVTGAEKKEDKPSATSEFPFYYNVNMLQKVQTNAVSTIGAITTDDKGCYRFDVQPVGYNTLLNQMSIAAATNATFKCDICGLVFGHMSLLNHHKRIHNTTPSNLQQQPQQVVQTPTTVTVASTQDRPYTCDVCGACFALPGELKSHKTNMHQKPKVQICEDCGSDEPCEHHPTKVKKTIKPGHHPVKRRGVTSVTKCHKCNGTGIIFIGKDEDKLNSGISSLAKCGGCKATGRVTIGSGKQNSQNQPEKPFHCNVCDGTFSRYSSLWSHKRLHSGDKPFKCEVCGLAFAKAAYLKNHGRVHTGEKPFKCSVCGMQFSQSPHLKNHERIHSGERPYQCEVCEKTFARHSTLWNHRRIHTGEKPYRCNICGSAFNQATHLKNHAKVHTGEKPHRCDICEIGFSDRFALKRHRAIHEKYGQTARNQNSNSANSAQQANTSNQQQQQQAQQQGQQSQQVVVVNSATPVTVSQGQGQGQSQSQVMNTEDEMVDIGLQTAELCDTILKTEDFDGLE
ncbi:transcription factor Clamp isoform X1 [Neodiprion pinetum]|uniref:transcription factor Clamp isoform X1 n=1 Tax=Neodiprion pinetum TaxID=441929 RepID=UPI001EE00347|nr:zinc finger protein 260-like isoform X1 [Neodiprion pinetum]